MSKTKLSKEKIKKQVMKELSDFMKKVRKKYPFIDGIQWVQYSSATIFCDGDYVPFSRKMMSVLVKEENVLDKSSWKNDDLYCYIEKIEGDTFYIFSEGFETDLISPDKDANKKVCVVKHPDAQPYMKYIQKEGVISFFTLISDLNKMLEDFLGEDPDFFLFCLGEPLIVTLTEKGISMKAYDY